MRVLRRGLLLLATLPLLAGCELPSRPDGPPVVAQVQVTPDSVVLDPDQSLQFRAAGRTTTGDSVGIDVTWSASAGAITPAGLYTADTSAADAVVTATMVGSQMSGTSHVRKRRVTQLVLVPAVVALAAGGTQQFATWGVRNTGDSVAVAVTYTATGGSITSGGLYTAGQAAGSYLVIARQTNGSLADTAAVTITVTTVPVASVTVSPTTASIHVGDTLRFTATPRDSAGFPLAGRTITWASDAASIATVSSSGLVTGIATGSATIRATSEGKTGTAAVTVTAASGGGGVPQAGHVFIVTEENTNYASVIGSSSMPYLNSLAQQYGLATQYYANTHPSIGNYFMLVTGQIITNNDSYSTIVTVDNVVRRLLAAGKTWKSYAEDLPSVGYIGPDVGRYARKHNTVALLSDVANDTVQRKNLVPFTQFATDLANGTLPHYVNIVPNLCNDAHDCSLSTADTWLQNNIAPILASPSFQQDGLLIITFDESGSDNTNGGGRIVWVVVSPKAKRGYQSTTLYQHQSTLRLTLEALGVTVFPGAGATAPAMAEFFTP
ncbi:MAG TPA: alkaline phosphatase family protein [Gemmatimonadales bacterium]|nr:alkaline phosphatase family protein [Gemmatimonadales bacterium]